MESVIEEALFDVLNPALYLASFRYNTVLYHNAVLHYYITINLPYYITIQSSVYLVLPTTDTFCQGVKFEE